MASPATALRSRIYKLSRGTSRSNEPHRKLTLFQSLSRSPASCCVCFIGRSDYVTSACSSDKTDKEPTVSVQVAPVEKTTIQHVIRAQAILFPKQQAAIVPKISAPVQKFLVKRGSAVHEGELLAVLENRDLTAAAQDTKGAYDQAQATYETTTAAGLPEEIRKAEADAQQAQQALDAQQKVYESRQQLFDQGALPRKELDQSRVDFTLARNQSEIAKKHLEALMAIGKQQELKAAAGQLESAKGKYLGRRRSSVIRKFAAQSTALSPIARFTPVRWRRRARLCSR